MNDPDHSRTPNRTLPEWLRWIESIHHREIELGLDRVREVLRRMELGTAPFAVITVGGTNGKGSTVAMIEHCLSAAGYAVGSYTSPHLLRYNERVRVAGQEATDAELCAAFERVESVRGSVSLTYFEYGTLAALEIFRTRRVEIVVLEVGMGGRLDAVNALDPDVAVVTSIGIDHAAWLGADRESIGYEKAGIFRTGRPAICGDLAPPVSLEDHARALGARWLSINRDFSIEVGENAWVWRFGSMVRAGLPFPALRGDYQLRNAACALAALATLADRFPITQTDVRNGLLHAVVPGRLQVLPGKPVRVLDVAHNPDAAQALASTLSRQFVRGSTYAVFGALDDKDIDGVVRAMRDVVDQWYIAALDSPRTASVERILQALAQNGINAPTRTLTDIATAYDAACGAAGPEDRVVAFGSFYVVGGILARPH